jgi:hypothetical protein
MGEAMVRRLARSGAVMATTARSALPEGQSPDAVVQADIRDPERVQKVVGGPYISLRAPRKISPALPKSVDSGNRHHRS